MWTSTKLILAVVLVSTVAASTESSELLCDVNNLDDVNVPKILNGTLFMVLSTQPKFAQERGVVMRYEQKDPNTLIKKIRVYVKNTYRPNQYKCNPENGNKEFSVRITEHGLQRKNGEVLIIAHSDNHIALMFESKNRERNGILFIFARNFTRPLKMTDIDSAMLQKISERCGERATRLDFYTRKWIPKAGDYCPIL